MTTSTTALSIASAVVHPGPNGTEQITITVTGALAPAVAPAGNAASRTRPSVDRSSSYVPTGYVGTPMKLTTDDAGNTLVALST